MVIVHQHLVQQPVFPGLMIHHMAGEFMVRIQLPQALDLVLVYMVPLHSQALHMYLLVFLDLTQIQQEQVSLELVIMFLHLRC